MNIRTITNPVIAVENVRAEEVRAVKTEVSSEDRDPDGRRHQEEPNKNPLNAEELLQAIKYLESVTGLTAKGLSFEFEKAGDLKIFVVKDPEGQVVRRIVEWELRALLNDKDKKTGQIFDKAA
ncbi:MAG: hypothetical protein A2Z20_05785 [Bdellovibrionales bacterium RBG_16_40_8]|nr:MAG: hypothetical protein A2Z20_05785 [Bdellovibrionales bacterium RBG_16_40_8]